MTGDSFRGGTTRRKSNFLLLTLLVTSLLYLSVAAYSGSLLPLRLVKGTSMEPTLKAGDVVVVKRVPLLEIKAGDIIAFTTPEALKDSVIPGALLHRVIDFKVTDKGLVLITQGDNANVDPFPVPPQEVRGRMVARIPFIGWPLVFLTSAKGILFLSIGVLLALLYIPAMALFYSNTVRKPDGGQKGGAQPGQTVVETVEIVETLTLEMETETVETLTLEQDALRDSLLQMRLSLAKFATCLQSHTAVVHNLADTSHRLKEANKLPNRALTFQAPTVSQEVGRKILRSAALSELMAKVAPRQAHESSRIKTPGQQC